ncbi:MAG TPA: YfhO family protein [Candidatus Eisenbacteria bacterium]|nr:YfhO family protein [Candidatus Eisenbacteria bacterium]
MKLSFRLPSADSRPDQIDAWFTPRRFAFALLLWLVALFPKVIFGTHTFVFRDYGLFGYPLAHYYRESLWRVEVPLWNPLNNCGIPFLAQWNTMVLYPLSLFYLVFPLPWSLAVFCLGHLFLAGLGMYFLTHRWTGHRFAACVAGLAYAFNGVSLSSLMWPAIVAAVAWMPWVVLCVEKAWQEGGRAVILAALLGAMQMLTGAPEVFLFTWVFLGMLWVRALWHPEISAARCAARFLSVIALIVALTAAQSLPFWELLKHSQRDASYSTGSVSMPLWGWANLWVPLFHCSRSAVGVFFQAEEAWISSYYPGIGILLLVVLALLAVRQWRVGLLGVVAAGSLVLAMGENTFFYGWLHRVLPLVGFIKFPIKLVMLLSFCWPLLAAFGVARYFRAPMPEQQGLWRGLLRVGIVFTFLVLAILWYAYRFPAHDEQWRDTLSNGLVRLLVLGFFLVLCWGVVHWRVGKHQFLNQLALLLTLVLDVVIHVPWQNPTVDGSIYSVVLPPLQQLDPRPGPGESRAMLTKGAIIKFHETMISSPFDGYLCSRLGLYDNCNLLENISKVDGFYPLYLREERETRFSLYLSTNSVLPHLADFIGVSQVSSRTNYLEWEPRTSFLPMIIAGQKPVFVEPEKALSVMVNTRFDPTQTVFVPDAAKPFLRATKSTNAKILSRQWNAHRITVDMESAEPAMLVIAQTFYPPWKAYVDGNATKVWRANHAFQALEVPPGRHQVRLVYEDRMFQIGATVSLATLLACATAWFLYRKPDTVHSCSVTGR